MDCDKLLESLAGDSRARLRHIVLGRVGICPFGLRAKLVSDRQIIAYACQMVLDMGAVEKSMGCFDMDRFLEMKEGAK